MDLNDSNGALAEIENARRDKPVYPEASAAEGRVYRETGQTDEAIGSFNRAIRESHGFNRKRTSGWAASMKTRVSTNWPRANIRSRSINSLIPNRSSTNCWAQLTRKPERTKKQLLLTRTICGWRRWLTGAGRALDP